MSDPIADHDSTAALATADALAAALEPLIHRAIREELRLVGLRPPAPPDLGSWRWCDDADAWLPVGEAALASGDPDNPSTSHAVSR